MRVSIPCAVCSTPVPLLCFRRRGRGPREAMLTFRDGERIGLARTAEDVHALCDAHLGVWESSALAQAWLATAHVHSLCFTTEQFGRYARGRGVSVRALKKWVIRDAEERARASRRKRGRHDWAIQWAKAWVWNEENPWAKFAILGFVGYGVLNFIRRAA